MTHRERLPWCQITYYKNTAQGGLSSCQISERWDVCRVEGTGVFGDLSYIEFTVAECERGKMQTLLSMLEKAYTAGQNAKVLEIKAVLEIKDPRL